MEEKKIVEGGAVVATASTPIKSDEVNALRKKRDKKRQEKSKGIVYEGIVVKDGFIQVEVKGEKGSFLRKVAKLIEIVSLEKSIETGEITYKVRFESFEGQTVERSMSRKDLNSSEKLTELSGYGADIFGHNINHVIKHLLNEERRVVEKGIKNIHKGLGWIELPDGKEVFRYYNAVGIDSEYTGSIEIKPRGTMEGWKMVIKKEVLGNIHLELAVIIGASSVIVSYLSKAYSLLSILIHFAGDSSKGKTTAGQLAISTAGYPDLNKKGLMSSWNGTRNAMLGSLNDNMGLPMLFDELSVSRIKNLSEIIYMLVMGRDKDRMTKEGEVKEAKTWSSTIISTGESGMIAKGNQNTGQRVRIIEFNNVSWTKSAENADAIKKGVINNNGHAAPVIAAKILELGREEVYKRFEDWKRVCLEKLDQDDAFSDRISGNMGIIMLTADLAKEALELDFNIDGILELLVQNEKSSDSRNISENALEILKEQLAINSNKFIHIHEGVKDGMIPTLHDTWGSINTGKKNKSGEYKVEIVIIRSKFNEIMEAAGFNEPKVILSKWKNEGILDSEKDRLYRKRKLGNGGSAIQVYVIVQEYKEETGNRETGKIYKKVEFSEDDEEIEVESAEYFQE